MITAGSNSAILSLEHMYVLRIYMINSMSLTSDYNARMSAWHSSCKIRYRWDIARCCIIRCAPSSQGVLLGNLRLPHSIAAVWPSTIMCRNIRRPLEAAALR